MCENLLAKTPDYANLMAVHFIACHRLKSLGEYWMNLADKTSTSGER